MPAQTPHSMDMTAMSRDEIIEAQSLIWVYSSGGPLPPRAIMAGKESDGRALFIGRGVHAGCWQVGKVAPHLRGLHVGYGGKEIEIKDGYYVLCGDPNKVMWIDCKDSIKNLVLPKDTALLQGGAELDGKPLYVARGRHAGGVVVGKTGTHIPGVAFAAQNKEQSTAPFQVLARATNEVKEET